MGQVAELNAAGPGETLLSTSPLFRGAAPATVAALDGAAGLLVPHDGGPARDVAGHPERWAQLAVIRAAVTRDVPVLAWGAGAALTARALGAAVHGPDATHPTEWSGGPAGAADLPAGAGWTRGRVTALAAPDVPWPELRAFRARLAGWSSRVPGSDADAVGGEAAVRRVVAAFYARARADDVLGPVFAAHVTDWDDHVERVTAFWMTMLGGAHSWRGHLGERHAGVDVGAASARRWLELWTATVRAELPADAAALLEARARVMARRLGPRAGGR